MVETSSSASGVRAGSPGGDARQPEQKMLRATIASGALSCPCAAAGSAYSANSASNAVFMPALDDHRSYQRRYVECRRLIRDLRPIRLPQWQASAAASSQNSAPAPGGV